jgi:hypothetical protein
MTISRSKPAWLVSCTALLLMSDSVTASIHVAGADLIGSRSTPLAGGLTGTGIWGQSGVTLSWNISEQDDIWHYEYTLTRAAKGAISNWILELTYAPEQGLDAEFWKNIFNDPDTMITPDVNPAVGTHTPQTIPGSPTIFGVKFDQPSNLEVFVSTISFSVAQPPVWGDFYAKDGKHGSAWNVGFSENMPHSLQGGPLPDETDFTNWVPRPNGATFDQPGNIGVPEVASLAIWMSLSGIAGLVALRKRR